MILLIAAFLVIKGVISLGQLVAFDMLSAQLRSRISTVVASAGMLQSAQVTEKRVMELKEALEASEAPAADGELLPADEPVSFTGVSFSYGAGVAVLDDAQLTLRPGRHVAVLGPSGAGKSTFARLLSGLAESPGMKILAGERPIERIAPSLRRSVLYVPQDARFLRGTVAENVLMRDADEIGPVELEQCAFALSMVGLTGEVTPASELREGGRNLSGGQRQRLHLARAFLFAPRVLILDEPTNALDARNATQFLRNVTSFFNDSSVVFVSHDPQVLGFVDEVYQLTEGRLEAMDPRRPAALVHA